MLTLARPRPTAAAAATAATAVPSLLPPLLLPPLLITGSLISARRSPIPQQLSVTSLTAVSRLRSHVAHKHSSLRLPCLWFSSLLKPGCVRVHLAAVGRVLRLRVGPFFPPPISCFNSTLNKVRRMAQLCVEKVQKEDKT